MVNGLNVFRNYFNDFPDNYIIIGGTACDIIIDAAGFIPRATKDIDIILIVEALNPEFVVRFWDFIREGQYGDKEENGAERKHYRFTKPSSTDFPYQIELFSRIPDLLEIPNDVHLTPIPVGDDLSSLSAILMNEDYYHYTHAHCTEVSGLKRANTEALICLKAKAYLDMVERKAKGDKVDDKHIKKHKADVFRLTITLAENDIFELPESIRADMQAFAHAIYGQLPDKGIFKEMGLRSTEAEKVFRQLKTSFSLLD